MSINASDDGFNWGTSGSATAELRVGEFHAGPHEVQGWLNSFGNADVERLSANRWRVRRDLVREPLLELAVTKGLDLLLLPPDWRRPALVGFDGDATLLAGETIDELAREAGRFEQVAAITADAMAGNLDFEASLRRRVRELEGLPESALDRVFERIALNPGVADALRALRAAGALVCALSGGFHFLLDRWVAPLDLHCVVANRLERRAGQLTGQLVGEVIDAQAKADALVSLAHEHGFAPRAIVAVGDGSNDMPMLAAAAVGVAYQAKPRVLEVADGALYGVSMMALAELLLGEGTPADEG